MSRKIPNQKKKYKELEERINKYTLELERIFETLNTEAARLALTTSYDNTGEDLFSFKDFPETKYGIERLQEQYVNDISSLIYSSTSQEWYNSNLATDLMVDGVLKSYTGFVNREFHTQYYQVNSDVLKAFQQRKDRGLSLSSKLWKQSQDYRSSLESVISLALERGTSAVTLSKQISKYLKEFPSFQKDYKEKYGRVANIYDCEYRSARLARSEINIAYRTAEQTRWGQMDFVIGYEVKLSNNHNCKGVPKGEFVDICDYLTGKYPKDFKFVGWHPQCRCYTIPILKTDEEYLYDLPGKNEVKDVPEQFKEWIENNKQRAKSWESTPYFIKDNPQYISESFKTNVYNQMEKSFVRKGRTNLAMSRILELKEIYPNIPEVRLAAINAYTQSTVSGNKGATYREINKRLRNYSYNDYVDIASSLISLGLKDLPTYNGVVYRGTHMSYKKLEELYLNNLGGTIQEKAFLSSSMFIDTPIKFLSYDGIPKSHKKIMFEIQHKNGKDISKISEFNGKFVKENQHEILFDKGTKFKIASIKVNNDIYEIRMEEL